MVKIHPKDSGPIDTANNTGCTDCNTRLKERNNRFYLASVRKSKISKRKTHINVCPSCKESPTYPNPNVIQCLECKAYMTNLDTERVSRNPTVIECPCCSSELTEDTFRQID